MKNIHITSSPIRRQADGARKDSRGFTLIEMIVAIALFSVVITIAIGGFVNALRTQRQVAALLASQSNVSLALEQMARDIRTGYLFCHAPSSTQPMPECGCSVSGSTWTCSALNYFSAESQNVEYRFNNNALEKGISGVFDPVTGDNVSVKYLTFILFGNTEGDQWNPRITIAIGIAPSSTDPTISNDVLDLQTSISARQIDCSVASGTVSC